MTADTLRLAVTRRHRMSVSPPSTPAKARSPCRLRDGHSHQYRPQTPRLVGRRIFRFAPTSRPPRRAGPYFCHRRVFYDDAQNVYGHPRPNWRGIGLNVVGGRAHVMTECFRNTRPVIERAFNFLYGSWAKDRSSEPTRAYGDVTHLEKAGLLVRDGDRWRVYFAPRDGLHPQFSLLEDRQREDREIVERLRWLIEAEELRAEDILLLTHRRDRAQQLAELVEAAQLKWVDTVHLVTRDRDAAVKRRGQLSVSTAASAKGYDAYCVLVAGAHDFPPTMGGRAYLYVACTRALEYLEVFASARTDLVGEIERSFSATID